MKKNIRIYADITGDLFHYGHISFFQQARELGDYLIIGVLSDKTISEYKREPIIEEFQRYEMIRNCRLVNEVIEDAPMPLSKSFLEKHKIDLVVHGDDKKWSSHYKDPIEMGTVTLVTDVVGFGVHISIRGKTRQTEGDFSDFFWVVLRLVQHLSC